MDPSTTLLRVYDAETPGEAADEIRDLLSWLAAGGFLPTPDGLPPWPASFSHIDPAAYHGLLCAAVGALETVDPLCHLPGARDIVRGVFEAYLRRALAAAVAAVAATESARRARVAARARHVRKCDRCGGPWVGSVHACPTPGQEPPT